MQQEVEKAWKISVQDELIRNTQLKMQHIDEIQTWIRSQSQLPKISDNQVILFLHAARYNLAEAKKLIETYYKMRTQYRHYFAERDPLNESTIQAFNVAPSVIHGKDNLGRRILWSKLLDTDPQVYFPTIATKVMFMVLDIDQVENGTVPGYTLVLDGRGFSFSHAMRCSFTNGRQVVAYVQTASTVIIEKVYLLNLTSASEKLLYLLRPFIRSELLNKITTCTEDKISKIEEMIPKSSIPSDYNGEAPSIKALTEAHLEKLQSYRDWFLQEGNLRMKDVKSIPSNETPLELEGTFNWNYFRFKFGHYIPGMLNAELQQICYCVFATVYSLQVDKSSIKVDKNYGYWRKYFIRKFRSRWKHFLYSRDGKILLH